MGDDDDGVRHDSLRVIFLSHIVVLLFSLNWIKMRMKATLKKKMNILSTRTISHKAKTGGERER